MSLVNSLRAEAFLTLSESRFFKVHFIEKLNDLTFALRFIYQYQQPVYRRIKKIEERHTRLKHGDLVLLRVALTPGGDAFTGAFTTLLEDSDWWIHAVKFTADNRPTSANTIFVATKFLLGLPRSTILNDEVDKELRLRAQEVGQRKLFEFQEKGDCGRKARLAAKRRVDRAKQLAFALYPFLVRGFVKEMMAKARPSSSIWVRVGNGKHFGYNH